MGVDNVVSVNNAGLNSLSGFSYQIKVFMLQLARLKEKQRVEFETLDDVTVRYIPNKDSVSDSCIKWNINDNSFIEVFQVKQTNVTDTVGRQVLYNWLLAYNQRPEISRFVLYVAQGYSSNISELAEFDFRKNGFYISYLKNGNIIQPQILDDEQDNIDQLKNYYTGSMARHTLMQLCGYLGFLCMLIKENKYPLIPFLVIDHISKPFDSKNQKALGAVLHEVYKDIQKSELQIILFDDENASDLGMVPDYNTDLLGKGKSGFNPYYIVKKEEHGA